MSKRCRTRRNLWPCTGCCPSQNHYQNHGFRRTIAHTVDNHHKPFHFFARRCNYSRKQDICSAAHASSNLYLQYGIMISASDSDRQTVNSNLKCSSTSSSAVSSKYLAGWLAGWLGWLRGGVAGWLGWLGLLAWLAWLAGWLPGCLASRLAGCLAS